MDVEIMRMPKGGRMDHHLEDYATQTYIEPLRYNGMNAAELTLARAISKRERLAKEAKIKPKYYKKGVLQNG